ncbi:MAG: hypothetical protein SOT05_05585 [Anaerovoracaceae bacterium]|nr:hypothetical protein [Anaerovoracaceae bacterium]
MEILSDAGSTPAISTIFQDSGKNAWVLLFPTVLCDKASSIKASATFKISFQTRFRLSQTTETGDETGGFLMVLGMKQEDFDSFEPGESE